MKKTLIIAEKPNQARDYANALGGFSKQNGYFESKDYFLTWCFGHLIQLETDEKYRPAGFWKKEYLPIIPEQYQYCIGKTGKVSDSGKVAQVAIIKDLISKSDLIINATDADREGELIFLYVYNFLNCKLPYKRLWISSLTENDIRQGFKNLLSANDVKYLGRSGYARAIADWLVGINGTQAATLQLGKGALLTIGRVQTAILKIICQRYLKNINFQKSFTYKIKAEHFDFGQQFFSETDTFQKKEEAEQVLSRLIKEHTCTDRDEKQIKVGPPLLHSIDSLIVDANKKFSYTGQETLNCAQSLYEKKLTSYPRTDSNYINQENFSKLKNYIPGIAKSVLGIEYKFEVMTPKSVNDKKLTGSHDAIVPTGQTSALGELNENELNIYKLIVHRCLESFSVPAEYKRIKLLFDNNSVEFSLSTSKLLKDGWKFYSYRHQTEQNEKEVFDEDEQDLDLPYKKGDKVKVNAFGIKEITSKPPALYTEATLTPDLTNMGKFLKEENPELLESLQDKIDLSDVQIGTQATRPYIIERLKKLGFIEVKKNKFLPTDKGLSYYEIIKNLEVANIATTAILEKKLKDIADGVLDEQTFYTDMSEYTHKIVSDIFEINSAGIVNSSSQGICLCPKCNKGFIKANKTSYFCTEYKNGCSFSIWNTILEKKLSETNVKDLCTKKITREIKGFKGKKGEFNAKLKLNNKLKIEFDFTK